MTIEQEIKLQARNLAKDMAQDMAKDIAKDMARNMANDIASEKTLQTAKNLLKINISPEQIASVTGLSLEQVKSLKTGKS